MRVLVLIHHNGVVVSIGIARLLTYNEVAIRRELCKRLPKLNVTVIVAQGWLPHVEAKRDDLLEPLSERIELRATTITVVVRGLQSVDLFNRKRGERKAILIE